MSNRVLVITLFACSFSNLLAADVDLIETSTTEIASMIAEDLHSAFVDVLFYADQLVGLDRDSVAHQISLYQASCLVAAYVRLAQKHSVELEDVFVGAQGGLIDTGAFSSREVRAETADCSKNAFIATGIKWNSSFQN